jgi:uncharacterized protein
MKKLDVIAAVLLVIGGLNWALVGAARFDLVAAIFSMHFRGVRVGWTVGGLPGSFMEGNPTAVERRARPGTRPLIQSTGRTAGQSFSHFKYLLPPIDLAA